MISYWQPYNAYSSKFEGSFPKREESSPTDDGPITGANMEESFLGTLSRVRHTFANHVLTEPRGFLRYPSLAW